MNSFCLIKTVHIFIKLAIVSSVNSFARRNHDSRVKVDNILHVKLTLYCIPNCDPALLSETL